MAEAVTPGRGTALPDAGLEPSAEPRVRRRKPLPPFAKLAIVLGCVLAAVVLVDVGARLVLQWKISQSVEESMPAGVEGRVDTSVGGFSALWQLANRRFDHLELAAPDLRVAGVTLDARVDAYGVSAADPISVEQLAGSVTLTQDSVNAMNLVPGATGGIVLGEDEVSYATAWDVFGTPVNVDIDASVRMQGDRLVIQATRLQVVGGSVDFDALQLLPDASTVSVPICSAEYLPAGMHLTGVDVNPGTVTFSVTATTIALDESTLASRGVCS